MATMNPNKAAQIAALEQLIAQLLALIGSQNAAPAATVTPASVPVPQVAAGLPPAVVAPTIVNAPAPGPVTIPTVQGPQVGTAADGSALYAQVDTVVPSGTAGTVTMPVTGHVLSLPRSGVDANGNWNGVGEGIMGYMLRTTLQCGSTIADAVQRQGALIVALPAARAPNKGVAAWPQQIDEFWNHDAYQPVDPLVAAANAAAWVKVGQGIANQRTPAPQPIAAPATK